MSLEPKKRFQKTVFSSFSANCARSYIGKNVNLHLKDGSTIINVKVKSLENKILICEGPHPLPTIQVYIREIQYAEDIAPEGFKG
jgi:hypothetical protein